MLHYLPTYLKYIYIKFKQQNTVNKMNIRVLKRFFIETLDPKTFLIVFVPHIIKKYFIFPTSNHPKIPNDIPISNFL